MLSIVEPVRIFGHLRFGQTYDISRIICLDQFLHCQKFSFGLCLSFSLSLSSSVYLLVFILILPPISVTCFPLNLTDEGEEIAWVCPFLPLSDSSISPLTVSRIISSYTS